MSGHGRANEVRPVADFTHIRACGRKAGRNRTMSSAMAAGSSDVATEGFKPMRTMRGHAIRIVALKLLERIAAPPVCNAHVAAIGTFGPPAIPIIEQL